jgi:glucose-fructose oxidoreductase
MARRATSAGAVGRKIKRAGVRLEPLRYAVVGLGWIAQSAILPAFANARRNSVLAALVSDDPTKLRKLGRTYGVERLYSYQDYDRCLREGIDAVFIALPNTMHRAYAEAAAAAGVHVLCEKPLATTEKDCEAMIEACRKAGVKLMVAYRLHFERANLEAVRMVRSGKLGEPRIFSSVFTNDVERGNVRLRAGEGGALFDIGIYCVNAARYLFAAEPEEVVAWHSTRSDPRFEAVPEMTSGVLRFPGGRLASFTCSFGASGVDAYQIVGTRASLRVDPAYSIAEDLVHHVTRDGRTRKRVFKARDQFAAELVYFSDCIRHDVEPEPSGEEGLADVRALAALEESARSHRRVKLAAFEKEQRPDVDQAITRPVPEEPELVHAKDPTPST